MPYSSTVYKFMERTEGAEANYARAREQQAMHTETEVARTIAKVEAGKLSPDQGRVVINGLTWLAKIRDPKTYGDKQEHKHTGDVGSALSVTPYVAHQPLLLDEPIDVTPAPAKETIPSQPRTIVLPEFYKL